MASTESQQLPVSAPTSVDESLEEAVKSDPFKPTDAIQKRGVVKKYQNSLQRKPIFLLLTIR